jgi:Protein of unknown function (DUF3048) N-terminal domain/Protein of unknown function (DUF3048) C-terminal domain
VVRILRALTKEAAPRRRVLAIAAVASASLLLAACSGEGDPTVTMTVTEDATANKSAAPDPNLPTTWPLTGVAADDITNRPALAIKVENSREARPQTGLEFTDVVWEEIVEGGVTRYIAVYHSQIPEDVGPIRSVRPMDSNIIAPLGGLMVFSGGTAPFVQSVSDVGLQVISHDQGADGFRRTTNNVAPHNVYGTPATFLAQADQTHQNSPGQQFAFALAETAASAVTAGTPLTSINITMSAYSHPAWTWDAASGTFLRFEGADAAVSSTGAQLSAKNVVLLTVEISNTGYVDPAGTPVPETEVIGSGDAFIATGGKSIAATWSKADAGSPMTLTAADGSTITLAPGNTWVELIPTTTGSYTTG